MEILPQQHRTPEIYGDFWFNSDPITLGAMRGYAILIDFWDHTSYRWLQTLPYLKEWHNRYAEKGLILIGVHTPEFPFGRDAIRVRQAIERLGIRYPVVMDNDYIVWSAFRNQTWPTKYLIDKHGFIRFVHAGEGSYQNFEHALQSLLAEAGYHDDFPIVMDPVRESDRPGVICYRSTPEILTGWQRGTIGNIEGLVPESTFHFEDPGIYLAGRFYLHGDWFSSRNYVQLEETEGREGSIVIVYQGVDVFAVIKPEGEKKFQVFVQLDDCYLSAENMGPDIKLDEEGKSYFLVDGGRMYSIIRSREFGEHKLKLSTRSNGFALYSMSFGSSPVQELVSRN